MALSGLGKVRMIHNNSMSRPPKSSYIKKKNHVLVKWNFVSFVFIKVTKKTNFFVVQETNTTKRAAPRT